MWDWDLRTGKVFLSARWKQILGYREDEIGDRTEDWFGCVVPEDLPAVRAGLDAHCTSDAGHFELEHRMVARDGRVLWVLTRGCAVRCEPSNAMRYPAFPGQRECGRTPCQWRELRIVLAVMVRR